MILPADMRFVQSFTPPDFQAKTFTPSIPPNFKGVINKKNNEFKWRNLHSWQEFYTAADSGGRDKSQLCLPATSSSSNWLPNIYKNWADKQYPSNLNI